jgi:hydroxylysine kinase
VGPRRGVAPIVHSVDAFMATMVAQSQPVPIERAVALVRERYGFEAAAVRLTGERDENFRLTAKDGREYVFKVANSAESAAVTDLTIAALLHLETADASFPCPRVMRELRGAPHIRFADEAGIERTARVLTYLPGTLLGMAARSPRQRAACGRLGGRLTQALRTFVHPAARRAIIWDVRYAGHLCRLLEQLPAFPHRPAVVDLLSRLVPAIELRLPSLRHQILHNDLNPLNILVDPADEARVTGIIDFGDLTHTAVIADVAVAAAELIPPDCADPASAVKSVLDVAMAYHERVPLLPPELSVLGTLVAARLVMNVVVHEWHVHHNPASSHFAALDPDFMRLRLEFADQLLREDIEL